MAKKKSEEQIWLDGIKRRLTKYISNPKWDYLELSDLHMSIITTIMNCNDVNNLSPSINERVVDIIFERIKIKMSKIKLTSGSSKNNEKDF